MSLLRIDIEARVAQFQDAMNAIERSAKKSAGGISQAFGSVNGALAGVGVSLSAGALAALVKSSIDAADHLNDLSKKTGVAVETLGGIGFAAEQAGSNLDGAAKALGKLNLSIASAGAGNKETSEAFRVMGINIKEASGQLKTADKVLVEIAGKFERYKDGPNKAALANALFGKSYADMLPLLDDGAKALRDNLDYFKKYGEVSAETARKADQFNDSLTKIKLIGGAAGNQIAAELLPTLNVLSEEFLKAKENSGGFAYIGKGARTAVEAISVLGVNLKYIGAQFKNEAIGISEQLGALASLDFGKYREIGDKMRRQAEADRKAVDRLSDSILFPEASASKQAIARANRRGN